MRRLGSSRAGQLLAAARGRWKSDGLNDIAAGVSFWVVLSLAPAVLAFAAMLGVIGRIIGDSATQDVKDEITRFLEGSAASSGGDLTKNLIAILDTPSGAVALIGFAIAVWSMSKGFAALFRGISRINGLPEGRTNLMGRATAVGFGLATVGVVLVLVLSAVVGPLLGFEKLLPNDGGVVVSIWAWVRVPVLAGAIVAWLAVLLAKGPAGGLRWRQALPGAIFAALGWMVISIGFGLYLRLAGGANPIYGVLGGILVALTWLYLLIVALIVGGLLNHLLTEPAALDAAPESEPESGPE